MTPEPFPRIAPSFATDKAPDFSAAFSGTVLTPDKHSLILHPGGSRGVATVARISELGWKEQAVRVQELPEIARSLQGAPDVFLSQQSFYGWRRIAQLAQLGACYVDLDYHKTPWHGYQPAAVAWEVLRTLDEHNRPSPSCILGTGRGLLALWLHDLVPRAALPRWNLMQRVLADTLRGFGADMNAIDAARVFRLAGTINGKVGRDVRLVWRSSAEPTRWGFDTLADEVLPVTRAELHSLAVERAKRKADGRHTASPVARLTGATYWEAVLADLQRLRKGRWFGTLPAGQRDTWLFLAVNAMSWLCSPGVLAREALSLARECGDWSDREAEQRFQSVFKRSMAAAQGRTIEWDGRQIDPRYRFRADTIVDWLSITSAEMRDCGLRVLVDGDRRRDLAAERKTAERRRKGVKSRDGWKAEKAQARIDLGMKALLMRHREAMAVPEIAADLGVSERTVQMAMKVASERINTKETATLA